MMKLIEQTLNSRDVAEMIEKLHSELLKDIRRYTTQFNEGNLPHVEFFQESTYRDSKGEMRPCYQVTKKGCEFIAHKLTGTKGTVFTARYINRFHEMQDTLYGQQEPELPWFVRKFQGNHIVLERDFISITGVDVNKHKSFYRQEIFTGGLDWNGHGWKCNKEEFKKKHGFDYGDDDCMIFLYPSGVLKGLRVLMDDKKVHMNQGASEMLMEGLKVIRVLEIPEIKEAIDKPKPLIVKDTYSNDLPIQICITMGNRSMRI